MQKADNNVSELMELTARLNHESVQHAEPKAGMFLLFLVAGLTMIGTLTGMIVAASYLDRNSGSHWLAGVLLSSAFGGIVGCGLGMLILDFKDLVRWEVGEHASERAQGKGGH